MVHRIYPAELQLNFLDTAFGGNRAFNECAFNIIIQTFLGMPFYVIFFIMQSLKDVGYFPFWF